MSYITDMTKCKLCPRECGADRTLSAGLCGMGAQPIIAKAYLHNFEEPPISGTRGSGAIFFCGCNLKCGYCKNAAISHSVTAGGQAVSADGFAEIMLRLRDDGAHNINLVTAAHFLPTVVASLEKVKPTLGLPIVYNSSGYEKVEALKMLDGLVDVYLPDFKYIDPEVSREYSLARDYPSVAKEAIAEMVRQTGEYATRDGLAVRGTIIRHLVLPGLSDDGVKIMEYIARHFPAARVSIMSQYTPSFNKTGDRSLDRKITSLEYNRVVDAARKYGLDGFMQSRLSATDIYTPDF